MRLGKKLHIYPQIDFVLPLLFIVLMNLPYFSPAFMPVHDTGHLFRLFHFQYSSIYYQDEPAFWLPYSLYGMPLGFRDLIYITPVGHFFMFVGKLLQVEDVLLLFKASVLLKQTVFLVGVWMLARRLFKRKITVLFVCLSSVGGLVWYSQVYFNLHILYLFPLVLYLLIEFFTRSQPEFLWLAGIIGIGWSFGGVYFPFLWVFILLIFSLVLLLHYKEAFWSLFSRTWANGVGFFVFLLFSAIYVYLLFRAQQVLDFAAPDRGELGNTGIQEFLYYGAGTDTLLNLLRHWFLGWPLGLPWTISMDNVAYVGLLPLFFFGLAIFKVKKTHPVLKAFLLSLVVLVWLSLSGYFSLFVFYLFPFITYYRHLGLVFGLVKVLFCFVAGYGLAFFLSRPASEKFRLALYAVLIFLFMVDALETLRPFPQDTTLILSTAFRLLFYVFLLLLVRLYYKRIQKKPEKERVTKLFSVFLIVGLVFDLWMFQQLVWQEVPQLNENQIAYLGVASVAELRFQAQRHQYPQTELQRYALDMSISEGTITYDMVYNFAQFDACSNHYRTEDLSACVKKLLNLKEVPSKTRKHLLGCESPKLRLVPHAVYVESEDEAKEVLQRSSFDPTESAVIQLRQGVPTPPEASGSAPLGSVEVLHFDANRLALEANVRSEEGAWLVYADAHHPNWRATIDGQEAPIAKANLAFKALWLEAGEHVVEFRIYPTGLDSLIWFLTYGFRWGFGLGLCVLVVCVLANRGCAIIRPCSTILGGNLHAHSL